MLSTPIFKGYNPDKMISFLKIIFICFCTTELINEKQIWIGDLNFILLE